MDNQDKLDFVVVLPREEDEEAMHQLVQRAIEESFQSFGHCGDQTHGGLCDDGGEGQDAAGQDRR